MAPVPSYWQKLVQLVARAFYAAECPPRGSDPDAPQGPRKGTNADFVGLGVIALDALTRREWVKEDELAAEIKVHPKVLRRVLRYFEQEQLLAREHRKESQKRRRGGGSGGSPGNVPDPAPGVAGDVVVENVDELAPRALLHSYCTIDYARLLDVTQLRLYKLRKALKDKVQDSKPVLEYACPGCGARYTTLQAAYLIDFADGQFHCEACAAVLVAAEDAAGGNAADGAGGEGARQERLRATKALQAKVEVQLKPLVQALEDVNARLAKGGRVPNLGSLSEWAQGRFAAQQGVAQGEQGGRGPTAVNIDLTGPEVAARIEEEAAKELPPWLRAEAQAGGPATGGLSASSAGRSEDSTGTAAPSGHQNGHLAAGPLPLPQRGRQPQQQDASSTEQADIHDAYVRQYMASVQRRQAELAGQAREPGGGDNTKAQDAKPGSEGDKWRPKEEGGWVAAVGPPKPEPKAEAAKAEAGVEWEAAVGAGQDELAEGSDVEWEEA